MVDRGNIHPVDYCYLWSTAEFYPSGNFYLYGNRTIALCGMLVQQNLLMWSPGI